MSEGRTQCRVLEHTPSRADQHDRNHIIVADIPRVHVDTVAMRGRYIQLLRAALSLGPHAACRILCLDVMRSRHERSFLSFLSSEL